MVRSISGPTDPPEALLSDKAEDSGGSGDQLLEASPALGQKAIETRKGPRSASQSLPRRSRMGPRLALLGSDIMVLAACELLALFVVHQGGSGTTRSIILADALLSILLAFVMVLCFLANGLYPTAPAHAFKNSFTELRDIGFALGVTGLVVLGIDHLAGSLAKQATLAPATIVGTLLLASIAIPTGRIITRNSSSGFRRETPRAHYWHGHDDPTPGPLPVVGSSN